MVSEVPARRPRPSPTNARRPAPHARPGCHAFGPPTICSSHSPCTCVVSANPRACIVPCARLPPQPAWGGRRPGEGRPAAARRPAQPRRPCQRQCAPPQWARSQSGGRSGPMPSRTHRAAPGVQGRSLRLHSPNCLHGTIRCNAIDSTTSCLPVRRPVARRPVGRPLLFSFPVTWSCGPDRRPPGGSVPARPGKPGRATRRRRPREGSAALLACFASRPGRAGPADLRAACTGELTLAAPRPNPCIRCRGPQPRAASRLAADMHIGASLPSL